MHQEKARCSKIVPIGIPNRNEEPEMYQIKYISISRAWIYASKKMMGIKRKCMGFYNCVSYTFPGKKIQR